jgi:hypothetical protein
LLRASFRPPAEICSIRSLWRHRSSLIQYLLLFEIFAPADACYNCFLKTLENLDHFAILKALIGAFLIRSLFSFCFEINIFGFSQFYRNRIVRCYLGASRTAAGLRNPNRLTDLDFKDDIRLYKLHEDPELGALLCGFDRVAIRCS